MQIIFLLGRSDWFTTNGISLSREKFDFLVEHDFKITVSVDGPKEIHDKRRVLKNGKVSLK